MKMSLLKNPYRVKDRTVKVQTNISEATWDAISAGLRVHGFQDAFVAMLLHKFLALTKTELPKNYDIDSEEILANLLARLTLAPIDRFRHRQYDPSRTARLNQAYTRKENFESETEGR